MKYLLKQKIPFPCENRNGYIALVSILIVSALTLLIATSGSLLSIGESNMGLQENQAWEAFYLTTACAEDALMKLKNDLNYSGNETLNFDNGKCTIEPLEGSGKKNRVIKVSGIIFNQTRKIKIEIGKINPDMEIKSWQQVADF